MSCDLHNHLHSVDFAGSSGVGKLLLDKSAGRSSVR
jgi:hypothetical protein